MGEWLGVIPPLIHAAVLALGVWWWFTTSPAPAPALAPAEVDPGPPGAPLMIDLTGAFLLGGEPLHEGAPVEVLLPCGRWLDAELRAERDGWPSLWVTLGGPWEHAINGAQLRRPYLAARVSPDALLRRPPIQGGHHDR